jgi:hypothetical protein
MEPEGTLMVRFLGCERCGRQDAQLCECDRPFILNDDPDVLEEMERRRDPYYDPPKLTPAEAKSNA